MVEKALLVGVLTMISCCPPDQYTTNDHKAGDHGKNEINNSHSVATETGKMQFGNKVDHGVTVVAFIWDQTILF